jgi:P-type Ca2+ transporter type 2C
MVIFQMFHVWNARSEHRSIFKMNPFSNRYLLLAVVLAFAVHVGALYFSPAQFVLRVEPISLEAWLMIVPMALTVVAVVEAHKLFRRRVYI